jgi:hypothetical protein
LSNKKPIVVAGDGWAALACAGFLAARGEEVRWIAGTGTRILPPLPSFEPEAAPIWKALAAAVGIDCGEAEEGSYLREFKNKAFREPPWAGDVEETRGALWGLEAQLVNPQEARFEWSSAELEEKIREALAAAAFPGLRRIEGIALQGVGAEGGKIKAVTLMSGEEIECERLIFADRWSTLPKLQGLPKGLPFTRNREAMGILQATFTHEIEAEGEVPREGFLGALNRESGDQFDRHAWGYFSSNGQRSFWTLGLTSEEVEDNHEIGKRLRKLKSAFERMFATQARKIRDEQVRFEETMIFSTGEPLAEAVKLPQLSNIEFLTDGYGPSASMRQVRSLLGIKNSDSQAKAADVECSAQL